MQIVFLRENLHKKSAESYFLHFMLIVSLGDNLHEMPNPIFYEKKKKKYDQLVICWISQ